jgi:hypothetical protein
MAEESESNRQGRSGAVITIVVVFLLALYVLSPGPLMLLHSRGVFTDGQLQALVAVWAPLQWLYDEVAFVQAFYDWYMGWFVK